MPSFNLVGLDTVVNLTENVEYPEYIPTDISGSYFMHLYEAPELINDIFHFKTTDPELTSDTADTDMAFKCEPTKWPYLPFSEGVIRNDVKQDIKTYSIPVGHHDRITKNIGVQWLAKNVTGGYNNSDIFANEEALQSQYVDLDTNKPNDFGNTIAFKYYRLVTDIKNHMVINDYDGNEPRIQIFRILTYGKEGYLPVVSSKASGSSSLGSVHADGSEVLDKHYKGVEIDFDGDFEYNGQTNQNHNSGTSLGWTIYRTPVLPDIDISTNGLGGQYIQWEYTISTKITELRMLLGGHWGWPTRVILFGTNNEEIASSDYNWTQIGNPWNSGDGGVEWASFTGDPHVNVSSKINYQSATFDGGIKDKLNYKLELGGSDSFPLSNADTDISNVSRQLFNALIGKTNDNVYRKGKSIEKTRQRVNDMIVTQQSNQRYIITNYDGSYNVTSRGFLDTKGTNNAILPDSNSLALEYYNNPEINNQYDSEWGNYIHFNGSTRFEQKENYHVDLDHNNYSISMVIRPTSDVSFVIFDNDNLTVNIDIASLTLNRWHNINVTVNNGELKVYDGVTELTDLSKNLSSYPELSSEFSIGASLTSNDLSFNGDLASFLVLNKACTPQELVNLQRELYPNAMNPPNQYVEEKWNALKFKEDDVLEFGLRYLTNAISESGYAKDSAGNLLGTNKLEDQNYVCRINMKYSKVRWVASHIYNTSQSANFSDKTTANILTDKFMIYGNPFPLNNDNDIELKIDCNAYTGELQYVGLILIESGDASFNESNPFNGTSVDDWVDMVTNGPSIGLYESEYLDTLTQSVETRIFKWNASEKRLYIWDEIDITLTPTKIRGINPEKYKYAVPCVLKRAAGTSNGTITISSTTPYFLRDIPGQGAADQWHYNTYHLNYEDMTSDAAYTWIENN